ncbi:MAG: TolC family protein [Lentisphaeria bacterium]|nr:TolC family protein [Lentisphaeria bacterium]
MNRCTLIATSIAGVLSAVLFAGCKAGNDTPPAKAFDSNSYTSRTKDAREAELADVKVLTLEKAQQIACKNNVSYIAAYHAVVAAKMRYYQSLGAYAPSLSANFAIQNAHVNTSSQHNYSSGDNVQSFTTSSGMNASWLVFNGLVRYMETQMAKHNWNYQAQIEYDTRRQLLQAVAYAYSDILLAIETKRIAERDMNFQLFNLNDTNIKFDSGYVGKSDVLNFQIKVNSAIGNQIAAQYQYEVAVYALANLMGYPEGTLPENIEFAQIGNIVEDHLQSVDSYLNSALNNRPDLKAYRELVKVAQYKVYAARGAFSPVITATSSIAFNTNNNRGDLGDYHSNRYNQMPFNYGLNANWLIFDGLARYNTLREAKSLLLQSQYNAANAWLAVVQDVRSALSNYKQSVKQAEIYKATLDLVAEQRDLVEVEFRAGSVELPRLNEAQRDLVQAETDFVSSLVNVIKAKAQLEAATYSDLTGMPLAGVNGPEPISDAVADAPPSGTESNNNPDSSDDVVVQDEPAGEAAVTPDAL